MADRTANLFLKTRPRSGSDSFPIADGVTIGVGALVQLQAGYLNHWDETGRFLGVLAGGTARAGDSVLVGETSDSMPPEGIVDTSGPTIMHVAVAGTATQAKVGDLVYCADSDTANFTLTDTTNPPVGFLVRYRSASDCDVQLFTPAEFAAGDAGATWAT